MNRIKAEIIFVLILIGTISILSQTTTIYKTEYIGIDWNPWYKWTLIVIFSAYSVFNHLVIRMKLITNIVYSALTSLLFLIASFFIVRFVVAYLEKIDNQITPLGWQFKFKWLELLIFGLLLVVATEVIGKHL